MYVDDDGDDPVSPVAPTASEQAKRIEAELRSGFPKFEGDARLDLLGAVIPLVSITMLVVWYSYGTPSFWDRDLAPGISHSTFTATLPYLYSFAAAAVAWVYVPIRTARFFGHRPRHFGAQLGNWRRGAATTLAILIVAVPLVIVASRTPQFSQTYPMDRGATVSWSVFLVYEAGYAGYVLAEEFLLRGFLLFGLYRRIGGYSILVQTMMFAFVHIGRPALESFGAIPVGLGLGCLALRYRSFWWGAVAHAGIAASMDFAAAWGAIGHH